MRLPNDYWRFIYCDIYYLLQTTVRWLGKLRAILVWYSPEGIGALGMLINFAVALTISRLTRPTPEVVKQLVEMIRYLD